MLDSMCWIEEEYRLKGDKQKPRREQAWGSSCADSTVPHRSDPSFIKGIQPTHLQMGGREGKKRLTN